MPTILSDADFADSKPAPLSDADFAHESRVPATPQKPTSSLTVSAEPAATGMRDKIARWAQNVSDDIRHGTDLTGVGSVLKSMGAHGLEYGAPHEVAEFMGSIPLGALRTAKGAAEISKGDVWKGAKDTIGGIAQAAEIPASFIGGDIAGGAAGAVDRAIPSAVRAGENFSQVMSAAHDIPINISKPGDAVLRYGELRDAGGGEVKVLEDFLKRVTNPDKGPMTYKEARDFYSNATRLSADESQKLTPIMKRQVAQFTADLNDSIGQAAQHVGKLDQYHSAMSEYHNAMRLRALGEGIKDLAKKKTVQAAGAGAAGAYAIRELLK